MPTKPCTQLRSVEGIQYELVRKKVKQLHLRVRSNVKLAFSAAKKYPRECKTARIDIDRRMPRVICDWRDKK